MSICRLASSSFDVFINAPRKIPQLQRGIQVVAKE
jgi:hypothetical protein